MKYFQYCTFKAFRQEFDTHSKENLTYTALVRLFICKFFVANHFYHLTQAIVNDDGFDFAAQHVKLHCTSKITDILTTLSPKNWYNPHRCWSQQRSQVQLCTCDSYEVANRKACRSFAERVLALKRSRGMNPDYNIYEILWCNEQAQFKTEQIQNFWFGSRNLNILSQNSKTPHH